MNWKRKLALVAVPSVLALIGGAAAVNAGATPSFHSRAAAATVKTPALSVNAPASVNTAVADEAAVKSATEPVETADPTEPADPAEAPGAAGSGHADAAGTVDHQFDGNE